MKLLYATSIIYPAPFANRIQTQKTAAALWKELGDDFCFAAHRIDDRSLYSGPLHLEDTQRSLLLAWRLMRLVKREGFTHVYGREPALVFALMVYERLFFHTGVQFGFEVHSRHDSLRFRYVARHADELFCLTEGLRTFLRALAPHAKITILPDAVDTAAFTDTPKPELRATLGLPGDRTLIAYVGKYRTMGQPKGVDDIIAAVARVRAALPQVALLIVGLNPDEFAGIEARLKESGYGEGDAVLVGHVPFAHVAAYMQAADVLVMSYPNTAHYAHDMSPMKLFEYMASGVPVVTSDLPSVREILSDAGACFVPPDDTGALAHGIEETLADPSAARRRAAQARGAVRAYSWENRAKKIIGGLGGRA